MKYAFIWVDIQERRNFGAANRGAERPSFTNNGEPK